MTIIIASICARNYSSAEASGSTVQTFGSTDGGELLTINGADFADLYDYLQVDRGAYIDTGVISKSGLTIEVDFQQTDFTGNSGWSHLYGARDSGATNMNAFAAYSGTALWQVNYNVTQSYAGAYDNNRHTLLQTDNEFYLDDVLISNIAPSSFSSAAQTITIGGLKDNDLVNYFYGGKVYSFKIWDSGTLVRDFVPVGNTQMCGVSVAMADGLCEQLSSVVYYNQGAGGVSFVANEPTPKAAAVTVGGLDCTNLQVLSDVSLNCITPDHSYGAADVIVEFGDGSSTAHGEYNFIAYSPKLGSVDGGQMITIKGAGFSGLDTGDIHLDLGGSGCEGIAILDDSTITCVTTPHEKAVVAAQLTIDGQTISLPQFSYTELEISPTFGPARSSRPIAITADGLATQQRSINVNNGTVNQPAVSTGTSSIIPGIGQSGGDAIDLIGRPADNSHLIANSANWSLRLDLTPFSVLQFYVRKINDHGSVAVALDGPNFSASAGGNTLFTRSYQALSTSWEKVTVDVSGWSGVHTMYFIGGYFDASGSSSSRIQVSDISLITKDPVVQLGDQGCKYPTFTASDTISCETFYNEPSLVDLSVSIVDRDTIISTTFVLEDAYTFIDYTPKFGPIQGGQTISIAGGGFSRYADTDIAFMIDDSTCTNLQIISDTEITCITPAHSAGTVPTRLSIDGEIVPFEEYTYADFMVSPDFGPTGGGQSLTVNGAFIAEQSPLANFSDGYLNQGSAYAAPSSILPGAGYSGGYAVSLIGRTSTNFYIPTSPYWSWVVDVTNFDTLQFYARKAADHGVVRVATADKDLLFVGYSSLDTNWHMYSIDVSNLVGAQTFYFIGGYTDSSGQLISETRYSDISLLSNGPSVSVGGSPCVSQTLVSSTEITCITPVGVAGYADVSIDYALSGTVAMQDAYTYIGYSPTEGPTVGGTTVIFSSGDSPLFGDYDEADLSLKFGGIDASYEIADEYTVTAQTPPSEQPEKVDVTLNIDGTDAVWGDSVADYRFEYVETYLELSIQDSAMPIVVSPTTNPEDSQDNYITTATNNTNGYSLLIEAASPDLVCQDNIHVIPPQESPSVNIGANRWGYKSGINWTGITNTSVVFDTYPNSAPEPTGRISQLQVGVRINHAQASCDSYSTDILITAIPNI